MSVGFADPIAENLQDVCVKLFATELKSGWGPRFKSVAVNQF
jgi:hypothetical protein